jgi:hypothetical protein
MAEEGGGLAEVGAREEGGMTVAAAVLVEHEEGEEE